MNWEQIEADVTHARTSRNDITAGQALKTSSEGLERAEAYIREAHATARDVGAALERLEHLRSSIADDVSLIVSLLSDAQNDVAGVQR